MSDSSGGIFAAQSLQGCLRAIDAALRCGDSVTAMRLAAQGAARGYVHPQLLTLAAAERLAAGDGRMALAHAEAARDLAPRDPDVLHALGQAQMQVGRGQDALKAFDAALRQSPGNAMLHFRKGEALQHLSRMGQARREYERAVAISPAYPEALARLAHLALLNADTAMARDYGARALQYNSRETAAALALVLAEVEDRQYEEALASAQWILKDGSLSPINRSIVQCARGDAAHGLGNYAEAFEAYRDANLIARDWFKPEIEVEGVESAPDRVARLAAYFRAASREDWSANRDEIVSKPAAKSPLRTHVFLVGFPRSGTTLLEQILASHDDVETMEERDGLMRAFEDFIMAEGGLERLATLSGRDLDPWRKAYWQCAAGEGFTPSHRVFVDKMPLNTVLLPLISKLFPGAKILFALRDPRDVVLSCFRRRFGMSAQMYQFLTLEGAARYYDQVMGLADIYGPLFGLETHVLRYEDLVGDFEGEARKVCAFLGLDWDEGMRDFAAKTRQRNVNTPSAAQVARGLYRQGIGQWRAYAAQMQPVLPLLSPWCEKFGYEES